MTYTIRKPRQIIATVDTFGEALAWANDHRELGSGIGIFWGDQGSRMNLAEWRGWANRSIESMERRGISTALLLANDGSR